MNDHFDVIIIGTGAGGGTLLHRLAASGKRILILERGPFLPREKDNWDYHGSFKYYSSEVMFNKDGGEIKPGFSYFVGGNTKVYGAALFRLREKDFEAFRHRDGISPEWPIKYRDWENYYTEAEDLYQVHGKAGEDPTEPWRTKDYPHPPISHEPRIAEVFEILKARGMKPYPAPMGVRLNETAMHLSPCIRCNTCDGYPCMVHAKSDAEISAVRPVMQKPNVTLLTEAKVSRLHTSASGREITGVVAEVKGETRVFSGDIVVVSCGAVNSSALLLRSANDKHPRGLANNASGLVGRNLMKHVLGSLVGVSTLKTNPSKFQKTMAINDFYWGEPGYEFPMGNIQLMGKTVIEGLRGYEAKYAPLTIEEVAKNSIDWWLTTEDLPDPKNQVRVEGDQRIIVDYTENNSEPFDRLTERWKGILKEIGCGCHIVPQANYFSPKSGYFTTRMPMHSLGHQVGTCKFGEDPATSVLDLNCRAHDVDNLYVVDGSFFVSSGAVNPTLTIIANALRVGDHLLERLGAQNANRAANRQQHHDAASVRHRLTPMKPLENKVAIITGAVGNLGLATARNFQQAGAKTVLVDHAPDRLRAAFKDIANSPDHLLAAGIDLSAPASLDGLVGQVLAKFGRVDVLVNTVGGYRGGKPVHEADPADWDFLFNINMRTTLLCCRAVTPQMLKQSRGAIINVASRDGLAGSAGYAAYSASKSAVLRLTESLAAELKPANINVNCIMPGTIDTPQNRAAVPNGDYAKWVEPTAIAEVIQFLASDAARAINGAALPVYGKG